MKLRANGSMTKRILGYVLTFVYADGSTLEFDARKSKETNDQAMMHGYTQKLADAAALGKDATLAEKKEAMERVRDALYDGRWNVERESGDTLLILALHALKPSVDVERVREAVAKWTPAERAAIVAKRRDVADKIAEIRAERYGSSEIDADDMIDEFLAADE